MGWKYVMHVHVEFWMVHLGCTMDASNDEDCNQDLVDEVNIVNFGELKAMDEDNHFDNVDVLEGSSTSMEQTLVHLHETMAELIA